MSDDWFDEPTEEQIAKDKARVAAYDEGISGIDEAVRAFHHKRMEVSEQERPSVVTAWVTVMATTMFDDEGTPRAHVHLLGPRATPLWQDVGLLRSALHSALADA